MSSLLKDFEVDAKNPSLEARQRWRSSVSIVKNRARRFRMISNLDKLAENEKKRCQIQEKIRVAFYVQKAALQFIDAGARREYKLTDEVKQAGFYVEADELASMVRNHDTKSLTSRGGAEGIAEKVSVSLTEGVRSSELHIREKIYGENRYPEKPARSFLTFVWEALQDVTLIILMICAVVSIGVGVATEGFPKGMYDGTGILLSIILVVMVTAISDYKQSLQFRDLDREKKKIIIQVTRDGSRQEVSIHDLVVGDVVHLSIGDQVPADGIFISGYNLEIDESSLSGESEPSHVNKEKPFLLSGTKVQNGSAKMLVTTVGMRTEWGKLMETLSEGGEDETPLQVKLNGVATIIVVAVPEGLPLAVTLSLAFAMKQLMSDRALVRHLAACETMGSSTCICTDKTGTLTTNHMVVNKVWICENINARQEENFQLNLSQQVQNILIQAIFQNTGSEVVKDKEGKTQILGSPTERAILEFGLLLGGDVDTQRREHKILKIEPFNSDKKKMSVLTSHSGGKIRAFCKGASEIVLKMCDKVVNSNGESVPLSEEKIANISEVIEGFASEALRTLCLVYTDLDKAPSGDLPDGGYTLVAVVGIKDPVRPGVREAVQICQAAGITVRMVTGDNISTAKAIAKECGILTAGGVAIEGSEFRNLPPHEMRAIAPKIQVMARSLPLDKHTLVDNLRKIGEVVAVTGDGTNDAPALHEADIGLAMGIAGTEVAKENADVIIMDDNFATIVNVAKWGRAVYINIQKFVQFQLTVNVVALIINFVSACITGSAPLTAVQLLWVNMIMDTLGALALATEPPNEGLMKRQPIARTASFITRAMWRNIIGQSIYQLIVLGILNFAGKQILNLNGPDSTAVLNTIIFNSFVFCQVFNEINSREIEKINVFKGMFNSWVFVAVMTATVGFQVIIVEFLGAFASTVPLSWQHWLLCILIGSISMILAVGLKCIPVESNRHHDGYKLLPSGPSNSA
ncbi:putative calcium-transporting ATPase 11, plasma membrane-type [Cardamine amara subsp. amara]|uniref:Calcium-transporting ATPase n=1 Tax=Cardamine amara subsp. amara TaxID=228776 RepID=A0ABD1C7Y0_CARAN